MLLSTSGLLSKRQYNNYILLKTLDYRLQSAVEHADTTCKVRIDVLLAYIAICLQFTTCSSKVYRRVHMKDHFSKPLFEAEVVVYIFFKLLRLRMRT